VQNVGLTTNDSYNPAVSIGGVTFGTSSYYPYSWPPVYTDANGDATLRLFPSGPYGNYVITAAPPEGNPYAITNVPGVEVSSDRNLTITLVAAVSLSGQVLDTQNTGIPNVTVTLTPTGTGNSIQHATDSAGQYSFQVAPGDYNLSFNSYSWGNTIPNIPAIFGLSTQTPITLTAGESRVLDLHLPLKRVMVHVQDPLAGPVQNVGLTTNDSYNPAVSIGGVTFGTSSYYPYSWPPVYTDANGDATLWLFPSGPYGNYVITMAPPPEMPYATFNVYDVTVIQEMSIVVVLEIKGTQGACPLSMGFWKTHPDVWPLSRLWLGGQSYTQAELLSILGMPVKGDASVILAQQLIATKLNVANGSDPGPVITPVTSADNLLRTLAARLPYGTKPSSAAGRAMTGFGAILDAYNNGLATPGCVPPTFTKKSPQTVAAGPPEPEVLQLELKVMGLVSEGVLNKGQGQSLTVKLDAAMRHIGSGNNRVAGNLIEAFLHEVDALAAARIISPETRSDLADAALLILAQLEK
jgi:hypothetical protein